MPRTPGGAVWAAFARIGPWEGEGAEEGPRLDCDPGSVPFFIILLHIYLVASEGLFRGHRGGSQVGPPLPGPMEIPVTEMTAQDTAAQALAQIPRTLREPMEGDPGAIPWAGVDFT